MIKYFKQGFFASLILVGISIAMDVDVERKPLTIGGYMDLGQIIKGDDREHFENEEPINIDNMPLNRLGAGITQEIVINEMLNIRVGVGGLFFYPSPQTFSAHSSLTIKFGPGISEAQGTYSFNENVDLQFGFFGYKYNSDAMNLGEYLFRSNCYPGILYTGGWSYMNSAGYGAQGFRLGLTHLDGALKNDFLFIIERENFPMNSFSPGYVGSFSLADGAFEIGWGFQLQHLIPIRPSWLTPSHEDATWVTYHMPNSGLEIHYTGPYASDSVDLTYGNESNRIEVKAAEVFTPGQDFETLLSDGNELSITVQSPTTQKTKSVNLHTYKKWTENKIAGATYTPAPVHVADVSEGEKLWQDPATKVYVHEANKDDIDDIKTEIDRYTETDEYVVKRDSKRLTFRGIKGMARMSLNFGTLFGFDDLLGPNAFKFYFEAAVLGFKNQPFYYEDITERIPVMFGINIPTLKLLDMLSVQVEYYKSPYFNSEENHFHLGKPVPRTRLEKNLKIHYENDPYDWSENDIRWSVFAKRTVTDGIRIFAQVASDHMRTIDNAFFFTKEPVLHTPSEWYYLLRVDFGF